MTTIKILIAEDEPDIRELLVFTLGQFGGFDVVSTTNGAEAVEKAAETKPDLILLDVRMPRMTGYEACKVLKENKETAEIPVVFLSAKGQEAEVQTGMEVGAIAYILKPFAPDELVSQVRKILDDIEKSRAEAPKGKEPGKEPEQKQEKPS